MGKVEKIVVDKLIERIENGSLKTWESAFRFIKRNAFSKSNYQGINQMLLSMSESEYFLTANQAKKAGIDFSGTAGKWDMVIFYTMLEKLDKESGDKVRIPLMRYYNVIGINALPESAGLSALKDKLGICKEKNEVIPDIEKFFNDCGIRFMENGGARAYYVPSEDYISLDKLEKARSNTRYYKTLFHEMIHATGHESRLDRKLSTKFGSAEYSQEELVAEIGAAMLSSVFGIDTEENFENSAAYCSHWLDAIKENPHFLISSASKASKAVKYLLEKAGINQPEEKEED